MPTFKEDLHLGHKVPYIQGDDISPKSISEEHLCDDSVSERTIQDAAVGNTKLQNNSVSAEKLREKAVTPQKLSDDAVAFFMDAFQKKINDLQNQIDSYNDHAVSVSNEFGTDQHISISQKTLTGAINKLWQKIEDITGESLQGISLTVTPGYYIGEEGADIHITANTVETNGIFEHIAFYINGTLIAQADNVESFEADTEINETSVVKCVAKILGIEYERQEVVTHYNSFWLGAGTSYSDVMTVSNLRPITNGMRGAYDIEAEENDHIIIVVGESLAQGFIRADLNGVEIGFTEHKLDANGNIIPDDDTTTEVKYRGFMSEAWSAGTYNIDING